MKSRPESHRRASRQAHPLTVRRGFTMTELLVVITIMSILISLIAIGGVGFIGQARVAATQSTIKKVDEAIQERVGAINRWHMRPFNRLKRDWDARGWTPDTPSRHMPGTRLFMRDYFEAELAAYAGDGETIEEKNNAMKVLAVKRTLRELLPVYQPVRPAVGDASNDGMVAAGDLVRSFWFWPQFDVNGDGGLNAAEQEFMFDRLTDWDCRNDDGSPNAAGATNGLQGLDQPGEVFLYALLNAPVFGAQRLAEEEFRSSELIDPDEDGYMELADAWGKSLRFYRWPTRLVNSGEPLTADWTDGNNANRKILMPNAPNLDLKQDPDDRAGYLSLNHPVYGVPIILVFHDLNTWHAPLVVSAGPDNKLGLEEPSFNDPIGPPGGQIARFGLAQPLDDESLYDNISNHNSNGGL